ncbi:inositol polyphosphate kinase kcs1, partial [Perkinsus chesapeaki]
MPSLAADSGAVGGMKIPDIPEAVEPTASVPFTDEVYWTIRIKDYITVACHRYRFISVIMMAFVAVLVAYITHGDALGWMQQNSALAATIAIIGLATYHYFFSERSVYCIDHHEFTPPDEWRVSRADIVKLLATDHHFVPESIDFLGKLLAHSGTSDHTAFPPNLVKSLKTGERWTATLEDARYEAEQAMGGALQGLMDKTGLTAKDIDVLIINVSLLSPTPSLCALMVNKFGMRSDILTYNLSGMGCSANGVSIDLAQRVLQNPKNMKCVVISTESIAQAIYTGNERGFLVQNTLFRCGATAILLTNKPDTRA